MNKQVNYIIYAILLSLTLIIGYYFVDRIAASQVTFQKNFTTANKKEYAPKSVMSTSALLGKKLFNTQCASCHAIFKTDSYLLGFEERGPWKDRQKLYDWIRNPIEFMKKDEYTRRLKEVYGSVMKGFPDMTDEEIDAIVDYINFVTPLGKDPYIIVD